MLKHRLVCPQCLESEGQSRLALNMLRSTALEAEHSPTFDFRLIRRWRVQTFRARMGYWSPAMFGAAIAGIAVIAALQMITQSSSLPSIRSSNQPFEARRISQPAPDFPSLDGLRNTTRLQ